MIQVSKCLVPGQNVNHVLGLDILRPGLGRIASVPAFATEGLPAPVNTM